MNIKIFDKFKKYIIGLAAAGLFLASGVFAASPYDTGLAEKIDNFFITININADATINVSEKIEYNFGVSSRHGIIRDIPVNYQARGGNFNLRVSDVTVEDESGQTSKFESSFSGNNLVIKIGDENEFVSGLKVYRINYKINRAINYFDSFDELYWNVTGNDWQVPIMHSIATVIFPAEEAREQVQKKCFAGYAGDTDECSSGEFVLSGNLVREIIFNQDSPLKPGQGFTIVAGFPKGMVIQPTAVESSVEIVKDNLIVLLPLFTFLIMYYLWHGRGRDPEGRGTIIAQYNAPDRLTPGEVGTIIDEKVDNKDISANIINLAVNGYLKITAIENKWGVFGSKDYYLEKLKESDDFLEDFDKELLGSLFKTGVKVKISELKNKFYNDLNRVKNKIYKEVVVKGYFPESPESVRTKYAMIGAGIIFLGIFLGIFLINYSGFFGVVSLAASGFIIMVFGSIMPAKTKKGVDAKEYILGFKEYLSVAEKSRIDFHNAPEKNPERFEKLLPFAIVLGVEEAWAKQFEGIYNESPSWYSDPGGARFNAVFLAHNLGSFSSIADRSLSSTPSSSRGGAAGGGSGFGGGGFSGGGFGGGGGRSW